MALYKDYNINGYTATVNTEAFSIIICAQDTLWAFGVDGHYLRVYFNEDGDPETQASFKNEDGTRTKVSTNWQDMVS